MTTAQRLRDRYREWLLSLTYRAKPLGKLPKRREYGSGSNAVSVTSETYAKLKQRAADEGVTVSLLLDRILAPVIGGGE